MTEEIPSDLRIFLVEDDEPTYLLLETILPEDAELVFESDPRRAIEVAKDEDFDLVLLDIHLGDTSVGGIEIMNSLRETDRHRDCPIVAVTAYAMPGDENRFLDEGFDAYLSKPFKKKALFEVIRKLLGVNEE